MRESVKFVSAALDETDKGNIILRGVISPESLDLIQIAPYQREILPVSKINELMKAYDTGGVPDIELGMRGGNIQNGSAAGIFYLQDETFVIDGLQRITAAQRYMKLSKVPRLGAVVHFNTNEVWERDRFKILNTTNTKLSPNILIRNMRTEYDVVDMVMMLCKDRNFVMGDKVCWNQRMTRSELITGLAMMRSMGYLHSSFGPTREARVGNLIPNLQKVYSKIGRNMMRENIRTFWDMMDECFKVRYVTFKEGAAYLRTGFMYTLASVISDHANFWKDSRLFVDKDMRRKIALFPISDPEISRLAGISGGGPQTEILYQYLVKHINSGRRTKRLILARKQILRKVRNAYESKGEQE